MAKKDKPNRTSRVVIPLQGTPLLRVEYDTEELRETFEQIIRGIYSTQPRDELLQARVQHALEYTVQNLPAIFDAAFMRARSEAVDSSARAVGNTKGRHLDVHKSLSRFEDRDAKERLKARGRGQPSKWTKQELMYALLDAQGVLQRLGKPMKYETAREILQQIHPSKAPPTENALRLLLQRFKVDWKQFKTAR